MACGRICQQITGALGAKGQTNVNNTLFANTGESGSTVGTVCLPSSTKVSQETIAGGPGAATPISATGNETLVNGKPDTGRAAPRSGFDFMSIYKSRRFNQTSAQATVERPDPMLPSTLRKKLRLRPAGS